MKRERQQIKFTQPSLTKQAFKDECDVNKILSKYQKTQMLTHVNSIQGSYGDFTNVSDYQSALNSVMDAQERFQGLPAEIRKKFNNDPAELLGYIHNDQNYDEAISLGLVDSEKAKSYLESKKPKPAPAPAEPTPSPKKDA